MLGGFPSTRQEVVDGIGNQVGLLRECKMTAAFQDHQPSIGRGRSDLVGQTQRDEVVLPMQYQHRHGELTESGEEAVVGRHPGLSVQSISDAACQHQCLWGEAFGHTSNHVFEQHIAANGRPKVEGWGWLSLGDIK